MSVHLFMRLLILNYFFQRNVWTSVSVNVTWTGSQTLAAVLVLPVYLRPSTCAAAPSVKPGEHPASPVLTRDPTNIWRSVERNLENTSTL